MPANSPALTALSVSPSQTRPSGVWSGLLFGGPSASAFVRRIPGYLPCRLNAAAYSQHHIQPSVTLAMMLTGPLLLEELAAPLSMKKSQTAFVGWPARDANNVTT